MAETKMAVSQQPTDKARYNVQIDGSELTPDNRSVLANALFDMAKKTIQQMGFPQAAITMSEENHFTPPPDDDDDNGDDNDDDDNGGDDDNGHDQGDDNAQPNESAQTQR